MPTDRQTRALRARAQEIESEAKSLLLIDNPTRDQVLTARGFAVELEECLRSLDIDLPADAASLPAFERLAALVKRMSDPATPAPQRSFNGGNDYREAGDFDPREGRKLSWRGLFGHGSTGHHGSQFRTLGEFVRAAFAESGSPESRGMSGLVDSDGGYMLPVQFAAPQLDMALESSVVLPRASVYRMETRERVIPMLVGPDHSAGQYFGGFSAQWVGETSAATVEKPKTEALTLQAQKIAVHTACSDELLEDVSGLESLLQTAMRQALSAAMDDAFLHGDGAGKPLGILNSTSKIQVAKEVGQTAGTIALDNLLKMWARLHPALHNRAVFLAHPSTLPQLMKLSLAIGTAGVVIHAVQPAADGGYKLLGRPLILTEKCQQLGTAGDIVLADLSQYAIGLRSTLTIAKSIAPNFTSHQTNLRVSARADGQALWKSPITPRRGSDSLSWCVDLATRA